MCFTYARATNKDDVLLIIQEWHGRNPRRIAWKTGVTWLIRRIRREYSNKGNEGIVACTKS